MTVAPSSAVADARADLPSGPVMFLAEVIADAIGEQNTIQDERNGIYWLAGGVTPQSSGCKINLRDVAEAVLVNLPDAGYGRQSPELVDLLREAVEAYAIEVGPGGPGGFVARGRALIAKAEGK